MASSSDLWSQISANQKELDPYLKNAGTSGKYFTDEINKLFNYNMPAIQNAAGLEAKAYSLPGEMMTRYDSEYGGQKGLGGMSRMNSVLKGIGNQFGLSNAAWNMVDKAKMRQEDLVNSLSQQYMAEMQAKKDKHNMLLPIWQQMFSEEQANARAARGGGGGGYTPRNWDITVKDTDGDGIPDVQEGASKPGASAQLMAGALLNGTFKENYMPTRTNTRQPTPAPTKSTYFNDLVSRIKGY